MLKMLILVMVYTRGAVSDYDDWETEHGNVGWGSKYIIPLLKKVCSYYNYLCLFSGAHVQLAM